MSSCVNCTESDSPPGAAATLSGMSRCTTFESLALCRIASEALAANSAPEFRHSCPLAEIERKNEEHNEPVSALEKAQTSLFASAGLGAGFHVTELDKWTVG